jgi:hypothetical protein
MLLLRVVEHLRKQAWTAIAIDFVIVVLGVMLGLQVNNWNEARLERQRTGVLLSAIRADLHDFDSVSEPVARDVLEGLAAFDAARARGERPAPVYMRVRGSDLPPQTVWDAALQSDLAELVHPNLLFDLGFFYSEEAGVGRKFERYAEFVEREILPHTNDPAFFYDAAGRLKPQYAENMQRLREWASDWLVLVQSSRCLQQGIDHPNQAGVSCRPDYDGGIRISAPARGG